MTKSIFEVLSTDDLKAVSGGELKSTAATSLAMTKFCYEGGNIVGDYTYHVPD